MTAKKGGGRPIGANVKAAAEALEALGGRSTAGKVAAAIPGGDIVKVHRNLRRSVKYGLITCHSTKPLEFELVDNWREFLKRKPAPAERPAAPPSRRPVSFVFNLGAQA